MRETESERVHVCVHTYARRLTHRDRQTDTDTERCTSTHTRAHKHTHTQWYNLTELAACTPISQMIICIRKSCNGIIST
jgi:16S rRNA G1207 methylase RsmC